MLGIDPTIIVYHLNVRQRVCSIKQKKRHIAPKQLKYLEEEVNRLLEVRFIKKVQYPDWLANVVMVKKVNRKWQVCIDFTDLNKALPKDSYPHPRIHCLVEKHQGMPC